MNDLKLTNGNEYLISSNSWLILKKIMKLPQLIYGIATFIPGVYQFVSRGTKGTDSARYCYSVWMRHLALAKQNALSPYQGTIVELGPGDSLGIGITALITGCERYFALDIIEYATNERNIQIFHEVLTLFRNKTPIPGDDEFPRVKPTLDSYDFPSDIFSDEKIEKLLDNERTEKIRFSIQNLKNQDSVIKYVVPWSDSTIIKAESLDVVFSQSVLQYLTDIKRISQYMALWLKPGGYISHQIDFKCQKTSEDWNGHWTFSDFVWKLIRGKRAYFINREPYSTYIKTFSENFSIVFDKRVIEESRYTISDLAPRFKNLTETDLETTDTFILGIKK